MCVMGHYTTVKESGLTENNTVHINEEVIINFAPVLISQPLVLKGCYCHFVKCQLHPLSANGAINYTGYFLKYVRT